MIGWLEHFRIHMLFDDFSDTFLGFSCIHHKKWIFTPCLNTALHHVLTKRDTATKDKISLTLMRISALNSCAHDKRWNILCSNFLINLFIQIKTCDISAHTEIYFPAEFRAVSNQTNLIKSSAENTVEAKLLM